MDALKIAIAGTGTVGSGVLELILKNKIHIEKRINKKILISAVTSRKKKNIKNKVGSKTIIFENANQLVNFDDYDILIELIGGDEGVAKKIIFDALGKGKNIVTANKALVAKYGFDLLNVAEKNKCRIAFEAAVAGGIPIIGTLKDFLLSNKIKKVCGILNGTSNFILSKMQETNRSFLLILEEAKKLGYAESDPSFDINGMDSAHKISIISMISFGNVINSSQVYVEGIEDIEIEDINYSDTLGYKIKLLGITEKLGNKISQFVYPCLINKNSTLANVDDVFNGVLIESDFNDNLFLQGQGAGSFPTASSVMNDVIELSCSDLSYFDLTTKNLKKYNNNQIQERIGSYYLRFTTEDKPGVIASISKEFKKYNISMKSMLQKEAKQKKQASIVVTTHSCKELFMQQAIKKINLMSFVKKKTILYRIEEI